MFLACVCIQEIHRPGKTNSFVLAVLASDVYHCMINSASKLVGARFPAPPSDLQVELS